jgi:F420-dependent oxidoreductase-like protein
LPDFSFCSSVKGKDFISSGADVWLVAESLEASMKVSLCLDPARSWPELRVLARHTDAAGWHAIYLPDHFMPHDPTGAPLNGRVAECWTTLSALATQTSRVRLGSLVSGNTYRHPALVANMVATLDQISGGRVVLGVGAGWQPNEHVAYGIPLPDAVKRIAALEEACALLRSLLDEHRSTISGATYHLLDAPCDPKPLQARLPLLLGGGGEQRTMRVAARFADVWHTWADPVSFARKNAVLDRHCHDFGRDPADIARATGGTVAVSPTPRRAHGGRSGDDVEGTTSQIVEQLLEFRRAGTDEFIVRDQATGVSVAATLDLIDVLTQEVLPGIGP